MKDKNAGIDSTIMIKPTEPQGIPPEVVENILATAKPIVFTKQTFDGTSFTCLVYRHEGVEVIVSSDDVIISVNKYK